MAKEVSECVSKRLAFHFVFKYKDVFESPCTESWGFSQAGSRQRSQRAGELTWQAGSRLCGTVTSTGRHVTHSHPSHTSHTVTPHTRHTQSPLTHIIVTAHAQCHTKSPLTYNVTHSHPSHKMSQSPLTRISYPHSQCHTVTPHTHHIVTPHTHHSHPSQCHTQSPLTRDTHSHPSRKMSQSPLKRITVTPHTQRHTQSPLHKSTRRFNSVERQGGTKKKMISAWV